MFIVADYMDISKGASFGRHTLLVLGSLISLARFHVRFVGGLAMIAGVAVCCGATLVFKL